MKNNPSIARPKLQHRPSLSLVWLVPLVTLLIAAWLGYQSFRQQGPTIKIQFATATGIKAGVTRIRYKDVDIGVVESLMFAKDFTHVELTAKMQASAEPLLKQGTRLWVVKPRLTLREVSGLGTLLSGAYIELDPGEGPPAQHFVGLETPPVLTTEDQGQRLTLEAARLQSIDIGSPIYYQGIMVGDVLGYELNQNQPGVLIHAFVKAPYDQLLSNNTRFWNISGIDLSMDADGVQLRTESLETLMFGGIAFDTPISLDPVQPLTRTRFNLWPSWQQIEQTSYTEKLPFVLYFDGSVRGLTIGAPVEFSGIQIGSVKEIRLEYQANKQAFSIPVLVEIEPQRITWRDGVKASHEIIPQLIERGLRARLKTGSLLTGQLFIELVMRPDSEIKRVDSTHSIAQLPTIPGELEELTESLRTFLAQINAIDLPGIATELQGTLQGSNRLVNHPALDPAISNLAQALASLQQIMDQLERHAGPISENLAHTLEATVPMLEQTNQTLSTLDEVIRPNGQLHFRVMRVADELIETAQSIRSFVNLIERPASVIFGESENPNP